MKMKLIIAVLAACFALQIAHAADVVVIDKPEALPTFEWIGRTLVKEPAYKSEKVRYTLWALGEGKKSEMTMVWDESGGTGKGYDTFYFDTNFNGDLTEAAKCFHGPTFDVPKIKEADGPREFSIHAVLEGDNFNWQSAWEMTGPEVGFHVSQLPDNLKIQWSNALKTAPVYHLGGRAEVHANGKNPGEMLATWSAGGMAEVSTDVNLVGDPQCLLRFYHSNVPGGGEAQILLRTLSAGGAKLEDIPFTGGCGCAGSYNKGLLIPSRVPPGAHLVVVQLNRPAFLGGKAEFIFPVKVENPDFGKPLIDPAYQALKAAYPGVPIASLRRVAAPGQELKGFPEENVVAAQVFDNSLYGPTRDWDMSLFNAGGEPSLSLGAQIHHKVDARTLMKFDLSALPKDVKISGAQLRLTLSNSAFTGTQPGAKITAYAMKREWNELECGWRNAKKDVAWSALGADGPADHDAEAVGSVDIGGFPAAKEKYRFVAIDLSELVKKWQGGEPNYGVVLKYSGGGCVKFHSSEFQDYPFRPTLLLACSGLDLKAAAAPAVALDADLEAAKVSAKKANKPLVVKFFSPTCAVCKRVQETTFADAEVKASLAKNYQYVNVNIDDHAQLALELGVGSVPAVVMLKSDGQTKLGLINSEKLTDTTAFLTLLSDAGK